MEHLHQGIKKAWILSAIFQALLASFFVALFLSVFLQTDIGFGIVIFFASFALIFIISVILVCLAYNNYKFDFRKDGIFIEKGIIFKKYYTIPYRQIQNVDLYRGIFARMFGYSAMFIQTAGYSGGYGGGSAITFGGGRHERGVGIGIPMGGGVPRNAEGYIPAIEVRRAEELRSWLMKKISKA